jgi:hypothetical protein
MFLFVQFAILFYNRDYYRPRNLICSVAVVVVVAVWFGLVSHGLSLCGEGVEMDGG